MVTRSPDPLGLRYFVLGQIYFQKNFENNFLYFGPLKYFAHTLDFILCSGKLSLPYSDALLVLALRLTPM